MRTATRSLLRWAGIVAGAVAIAYLAALAALFVFQERLIFPGTPLPADHSFRFDQTFDEVSIPVDGAVLSALHFRQPEPRGLVFFLHGNRGNLASWTTGIDFYRRVNFDFFIVDYRGYGKSTGSISSEQQLHADVRAAWEAVAHRYRGKPIVIVGRSLGTGPATRLAADVDAALLVLVSPYSSLAALARQIYPMVPEAVLRYPIRTDALIERVVAPVLLLHGTRDTLIPIAESERLLGRIRGPRQLTRIEGAGHSDLHLFPAYLESLALRLSGLGAASPEPRH